MFRLHLNMFIVVWGVPHQYNNNKNWHKTDHQNVLGSPVRHIAVISGGRRPQTWCKTPGAREKVFSSKLRQ